ncbi:serine or threonine protein kinase [Streptomyces laurentii]|uniref:non-specific serine/threonine protein kinase n=1 Tax=Streptomyces laurentii TaxID=39478 RepID=A0A160P148_STRLU|nr:serine or threonine protein kinase [Streptomyces laurentii]
MAQVLVADRYRLQMCVGRGGMGEVWRATDEVLGRDVAVKLMLGHEHDPSAADRFRMEAQTAARLSHPHVVGVFDFGTWDGKLFLVMELVDGDSLAGDQSTVYSAEQVATVAAHAAAGLAAAHRQGVVHRDIKPGNLLMDSEGTVKLADFGIARFVDDPSAALTTAGQIVGTGLYLAPERALGQPASPASDVYSLGCVLYQLLTGQPPFRADSSTALLYQHIDTPPAPPRQLGVPLPAAFESFLLSLLAKQPEHRPQAQAIADWFSSGAWRDQPQHQPYAPHGQHPQHPPHAQHAPPVMRPPAPPLHPHTPPPGPAHVPPAHLPPAHTPPSMAVPGPRGSRRAQQSTENALTELSIRRPRRTAAVAGAIAFVICLLIGMAWLS